MGIALDHDESSEGLRRVLEDEEHAEVYRPEVPARAREVLRRPMSPAEVSTLNVIGARHAEPGDADLLLDVPPRTRTRTGSDSEAVRKEAVWTAYGGLDEAEVKDERLVAGLGDLIFDPSAGFSITKETAIRVLADSLGADADGILLRAPARVSRRYRPTRPISWSGPEAWTGTAPSRRRSPRAGATGLPSTWTRTH